MAVLDRTVDGVDASRRVGWARFYAVSEELDALREEIAELCYLIRLHERLPRDDRLVVAAEKLLAKI